MVIITLVLIALATFGILHEIERRDQRSHAQEGDCPRCAGRVSLDWLFCPRCKQLLQFHCPECNEKVSSTFAFCPGCRHSLKEKGGGHDEG